MLGATIEFHFASADAERRFLEDYLADAWERFDASAFWEHGWFWRYGQIAEYESGPGGGLVRLVFDGEPDDLVAAERDRWAAFDGLDDWECRRYDDPDAVGGEGATYESLLAQQRDAKGPLGGEREYRFKALTARLALAYYDAFDDPLPVDPESTDEDPLGIGVWALLHDALVQMGFDWYDETDAALRMLRNRVKSIAVYRGEDAARADCERIRDEWANWEGDLDEWLAGAPTGQQSEP